MEYADAKISINFRNGDEIAQDREGRITKPGGQQKNWQ